VRTRGCSGLRHKDAVQFAALRVEPPCLQGESIRTLCVCARVCACARVCVCVWACVHVGVQDVLLVGNMEIQPSNLTVIRPQVEFIVHAAPQLAQPSSRVELYIPANAVNAGSSVRSASVMFTYGVCRR
jgi:hypothetical protein